MEAVLTLPLRAVLLPADERLAKFGFELLILDRPLLDLVRAVLELIPVFDLPRA